MQSEYNIPYKTYSAIIQKGNELYFDALLAGKAICPMPGLGEFQIHKYKERSSRRRIDWGLWKREKVYALIDNSHTDGYQFFVKWTKYRGLKHIMVYRFYLIQSAKRKLYNAIMNGLDAPIHDQNHITYGRKQHELLQYRRSLRKGQERSGAE